MLSLLRAVRTQVGMQVAWTSEFRGTSQVFRYVDVAEGAHGPSPGESTPMSGSFCARVLDGRMPGLIPDARREPAVALLPVTADLHIGAYLGVPLVDPHGAVTGMLCLVSDGALPGLGERDLAALQHMSRVLSDVQARAVGEDERRRRFQQMRDEVSAVVAGDGRVSVLQPLVDLRTDRVVAAEALSRFPGSGRLPGQWFSDAQAVGLREALEVAAAGSALGLLDRPGVPDVLAVNLSPDTVCAGGLEHLLLEVDPGRVLLEVTEHATVPDYGELRRALSPYCARGLRVAVDDCGAGYASLTHVLHLAPDVVKVDLTLVRDVDSDPARRALITALVAFTEAAGISLVAEGVETEGELAVLRELEVPYAQGFLLGSPAEPRPAVPLPSAPQRE